MTWAMLSSSPLGKTTFSDTDVNLLGEPMCAACMGGVGRTSFTFGLGVQQPWTWGSSTGGPISWSTH